MVKRREIDYLAALPCYCAGKQCGYVPCVNSDFVTAVPYGGKNAKSNTRETVDLATEKETDNGGEIR